MAVLLGPLQQAQLSGGLSLATMTSMSYPLLDLLLVAALAGVAALPGQAMDRRRRLLLAAGLLVFAASDVLYAYRVAHDTYSVGTPLDAGWAIGLSRVALGVFAAARNGHEERRRAADRTILAVPGLATAVALAVLIVGTQTRESDLAVVPAGVTLLTAAVRTQLAVREQMLVEVARRLREHLRPTDLLARLGGDEFAVLLAYADEQRAVVVGTKLRAAVARPFVAEGIALRTAVSVGLSLFPQHGRPDQLDAQGRRCDVPRQAGAPRSPRVQRPGRRRWRHPVAHAGGAGYGAA